MCNLASGLRDAKSCEVVRGSEWKRLPYLESPGGIANCHHGATGSQHYLIEDIVPTAQGVVFSLTQGLVSVQNFSTMPCL